MKTQRNKLALWLYGGVGVAAVVAGGLVAAFSAHTPTEFAVWASAYLVLVAGLLQVAFGAGVYCLAPKPGQWPVIAAFAAYNIGNAAVIVGTGLKDSMQAGAALVDAGGVLLAVAMLLLLYTVRGAKRSWWLVAFYFIVVVIFASMPIGLILARR